MSIRREMTDVEMNGSSHVAPCGVVVGVGLTSEAAHGVGNRHLTVQCLSKCVKYQVRVMCNLDIYEFIPRQITGYPSLRS